jgi:hypothetical protein
MKAQIASFISIATVLSSVVSASPDTTYYNLALLPGYQAGVSTNPSSIAAGQSFVSLNGMNSFAEVSTECQACSNNLKSVVSECIKRERVTDRFDCTCSNVKPAAQW